MYGIMKGNEEQDVRPITREMLNILGRKIYYWFEYKELIVTSTRNLWIFLSYVLYEKTVV